MTQLPTGTVTFLFSDIEGSTWLLQRLADRYVEVLGDHRRLIRAAVEERGGHEMATEGDSFFVVFSRARDAVLAAVQAQRALAAHPWPERLDVRVRMGIHTSEPGVGPDPYVGLGVHRAARICSAARGGQVLLSAATRALLDDGVSDVAVRDIGHHRLKDLDRPEHLFQLLAPGLPAEFPPPATLDPERLAAVPEPATPTVGRDHEVRAVRDRLRRGGLRLLTLIGPGGVGKTRLAIEVARAAADGYADGAHFARLSAVSDARELPAALARSLAVPVRASESPTSALAWFLGARELLLVLDNLEHLLAGTTLLADLLARCPGLTILTTSREPTSLAAERLHPVQPLEVPPPSSTTRSVRAYSAVELFCSRAQARDPAFYLDAETAQHVAEICRRLDGLPLAVELAAARVGLLTPAELAARLDDALGLLVTGARDAPERHRTLRATIDWSAHLLTPVERRVFVRLGVFAGGATLEAAESVVEASADTLDSLHTKSLVVRRGGRLGMLDTVRQYALEQLAHDPDRDVVYERLGAWCLRVLEASSASFVRATRAEALSTVEAELPNALAALAWAVSRGEQNLALRLVGALGPYWWQTNHSEEGLYWLETVLDRGGGDQGLRATALLFRARLLGWRTPQRHGDDLRASLALFRTCDNSDGAACCLAHLACLAAYSGDAAGATVFRDEAVEAAARSEDEGIVAFVLAQTALSAATYDDTAQRARSALIALRRAGDLVGEAFLCKACGYQAIAADRCEEGLDWLDAALAAARALEHVRILFDVHTNRGLARLFLGDVDEAARELGEALAICEQAGAEDVIEETLLGLGAVYAARGQLERAARFTGAALSHQATRAVDEETVWARLMDDYISPGRDRHGAGPWDDAVRAASAMSARESIRTALDDLDGPGAAMRGAQSTHP